MSDYASKKSKCTKQKKSSRGLDRDIICFLKQLPQGSQVTVWYKGASSCCATACPSTVPTACGPLAPSDAGRLNTSTLNGGTTGSLFAVTSCSLVLGINVFNTAPCSPASQAFSPFGTFPPANAACEPCLIPNLFVIPFHQIVAVAGAVRQAKFPEEEPEKDSSSSTSSSSTRSSSSSCEPSAAVASPSISTACPPTSTSSTN